MRSYQVLNLYCGGLTMKSFSIRSHELKERFFETRQQRDEFLKQALWDGCDMFNVRAFDEGIEIPLSEIGVSNNDRDPDLPVVEDFWEWEKTH